MSDHDRGAYTPPTDEPLAFDARRAPERRPAPKTLIASAVVLLVLIAAVVLFYRSGVRGANQAPGAVGEPVAAVRTPPAEEAQPIDHAARLEVYVEDAQGGAERAPTFAPPPEQPQPRPAPQAQPVAPTPAPTPAPAPAPRAAQPAAPATPQTALPPAVAREAGLPAPPAPAPATGPAVQIGAFSSTAIADREFAAVAAQFPQFASGKSKRLEAVETGGRTLYRTAFAGFGSRAEAQEFCTALKAAGRDCIVR